MLKLYSPHLPAKFDKYIEPFFGGGAMFIWAFNTCPNAEFIINDCNQDIMSVYRAIKDDCTDFLKHVDELESEYIPLEKGETNKELEKEHNKDWDKLFEIAPNRRHFYFKVRQHNAYKHQDWSDTQQAAVLYFLMKTGFNGIWQINKNTNNRFGTPFGLGKQKDQVYDRDVVAWWHEALQNTTILSSDFAPVVLQHATKDSFVFMDPPYRDSFTQYETDFGDDHQERAISCLSHCRELGALGWMSNRDAHDGFFEERWPKDKIKYFDVTYTAGRRKKTENGFEAKPAQEVLLTTV